MAVVAVTGHRPDAFLISHYGPKSVKRIAEDMIFILKKQYREDLTLNLGGAIGADQWAGQACILLNIAYKLYLPFPPEVQSKYWSQEHKEELLRQINQAKELEIIDPLGKYHVSKYQERNKRMVDDADFVLAFWVGKRKGGTFNCIKYALKQSKFVYNALDENSFIDNRFVSLEDLKTGWTPSVVRGEINERKKNQ